MRLIFLGTGSAFTLENYQSNMLVESPEGLLLIDCGGDARHSLARQGWTALDITDIYISHLHADHIGGLESMSALPPKADETEGSRRSP